LALACEAFPAVFELGFGVELEVFEGVDFFMAESPEFKNLEILIELTR
jgi:hypothetical protein